MTRPSATPRRLPRARVPWPAVVLCLVALASPGCGSTRARSRAGGRSAVEEIHLFGVPAALHLDGRPDPDGIGVRLYASSNGRAHGIRIGKGRLEILLYDGAFEFPSASGRPPLKTWSFAPPDLARFEAETSLGTGYQFALRWGTNQPTGRAVTVVARYFPPDGKAFESSANAIPVR
jgi:hypothetical protein